MGAAARRKRELREAGPLPGKFDFGPHHLARSTTTPMGISEGTVVTCGGVTGKVTDLYDDGRARAVFPGPLGCAPFLVPLGELSVADDQTWDWRSAPDA